MLLLPLFLHIIVVAGTAIFMFMINGHQAFLSRSFSITRADGSVFFQTGYVSVQSEIMTILSFFSSIARTIGAWRASGMLWRCVFLFMEQGRVSLRGVKRMLGKLPISPGDVSVRHHFLLFSALLLVALILDFASPVLTGSITWNPSYAYFLSDKPISNLPVSASGLSLDLYRSQVGVTQMVSTSVAMGDLTWGTSGNNSTMITRVVPEIDSLSNQSKILNITLPYFAVDTFEWIQDPNNALTAQQKAILANASTYSPYVASIGWLGLIPDQEWGPLTNPNMTDPLTVSETRVLSLKYPPADSSGCKFDDDSIPSDVGSYQVPINGNNQCFVFARLTYRAGAAICDNCITTAPAVVQRNLSDLTLSPDPLTAEALAMTSFVGMTLTVTGWALPGSPPFNTTQERAIQFISRAYQSAWSSLTETVGVPNGVSPVWIAVPTTQAYITKWRVLLWVALHLIVMLSSVFFFVLNRHTNYPWLEDPDFAVLFLDTEALRRREVWEDTDPWKPNAHVPDVTVELVNGGSNRRRIVVRNPMQKE